MLLCTILLLPPLKSPSKHGRWRSSLLLYSISMGGMGPLLVLVSPCFRENVVVICQFFFFFLCSLDNLLQRNVIVFFFENQISKWRSFEKKRLFLTYFSHFLVTRGKLQKFLHSHSYIHVFCSPYWFFFCLTNFEKKKKGGKKQKNKNKSKKKQQKNKKKTKRIYQVWFLFGMIPGVDSYPRHFGIINK